MATTSKSKTAADSRPVIAVFDKAQKNEATPSTLLSGLISCYTKLDREQFEREFYHCVAHTLIVRHDGDDDDAIDRKEGCRSRQNNEINCKIHIVYHREGQQRWW